MTEEKIQLIVGGLLHDIGKVIYRHKDGRKHSVSGYDFLKQEAHIENPAVLDAVKYHHGAQLKSAHIDADSFAYIIYIADNIASSTDRRKNDGEEFGFEMSAPLEPVFNILNKNAQKLYYHRGTLEEGTGINYPTEEKEAFDEHFYYKIRQNLLDNLLGLEWKKEYINSLLEILEANLAFVPSSTAKDELADISLYDHLKLTAAIGSCIYDYLKEKEITDFRSALFQNASEFYKENAFILFSMDVSGIQSFIYTIHSEGALRTLRARSFYLEIMMEHIVDTLLERLGLSRANLIYSGGGHCYLLLPNTEKTRDIAGEFERELNQWLLEQFDISLYVAVGSAPCSADSLKNNPAGSYGDIFRTISNAISEKKSGRYTKEQILWLNKRAEKDVTRECKVCKRLGKLNEENLCEVCAAVAGLSKNVLYSDFFAVTAEKESGALELPFEAYLIAEKEDKLRKRIREAKKPLRVYGKNKLFSGKYVSAKLWVGDYTTGETFEELAGQSDGIERIGVLRADVDNLGRAFVSGFERDDNGDLYVTLSRTAVLSRQLSMFFKYHINEILRNPRYFLNGTKEGGRRAAIVYSGGDDLFIVGAWNDVLELSVDIREAFLRYTQGTLSISAGIGVYPPGFPAHVMADEVAGLEEDSKSLPQKNAVTFLPDGETHLEGDGQKISDGTYTWDVFVEKVLGEKYQIGRASCRERVY